MKTICLKHFTKLQKMKSMQLEIKLVINEIAEDFKEIVAVTKSKE